MLALIPEIVAFDDDWQRDDFTEWWEIQWVELGGEPGASADRRPPRRHPRGARRPDATPA